VVPEVLTMATSSTTQRSADQGSADSRAHWGSRLLIAALELPIGIGAVLGGWQMLLDPLHPLGVLLIDDRLWLQPVIFGVAAVVTVTAGRAWRRGAR
jgi:hypothetical protein